MDYEEMVKKMFYEWDEEKRLIEQIQKCQRNWDYSKWNSESPI